MNILIGILMKDRKIIKDPYQGYLKKQYVLPDFHSVMKGYVKNDEEKTNVDDQVCMLLDS